MMNRIQKAWTVLTKPSTKNMMMPPGTNVFMGGGYTRPDGRLLIHGPVAAAFAYQTVDPLKTSVDLISEAAGALPMVIKDAQTGEVIVHSQDNPEDSPMIMAIRSSWEHYNKNLIELICTSKLLFGEVFVEMYANPYGYFKGLKWLNSMAVSINYPQGEIESYTYTGSGRVVTLPRQKVLYFRSFNPMDDVRGYSTTMSILSKAKIEQDFDRFVLGYYSNGAQVGVYVRPKDGQEFHEREWAEFKQSFEKENTGVGNAFKSALLRLPLDIDSMDTFDISEPLQVSGAARDSIRQAFRIPQKLVGIDGAYQFDSETERQFFRTVVGPHVRDIEEVINYRAMPMFEEKGRVFAFDLSDYDADPVSVTALHDRVRLDFQAGVISFNQRAQMTGEEPIDNDFFLIQSNYNMVPVADMGHPLPQPEPAPTMTPPPALGDSGVVADDEASLDDAGVMADDEALLGVVSDRFELPIEQVRALYVQYMSEQ